MPIFDYKCEKCGTVEEDVLLRTKEEIAQADQRVCPECGAPTKKLVGKTVTHFSGFGWPSNDAKLFDGKTHHSGK